MSFVVCENCGDVDESRESNYCPRCFEFRGYRNLSEHDRNRRSLHDYVGSRPRPIRRRDDDDFEPPEAA